MPSPRACVYTAAGQNVVTTAETVIATVGPVNVNAPASQGVIVEGTTNFLAGTAATAVTVRIRQGANTLTGTVLATHTYSVTAGSTSSLSPTMLDTTPTGALTNPPNPNTAAYTMTVQQTAATGNGTATNTSLSIEECVGAW